MKNTSALTRLALAAVAAASLAAPVASQAAEGPWLVRARALNLDPANKDSTGLDLNVNSKVIPELDITYFFTPNIAAELVLTVPQKHDIKAGDTKIGSLKHLPPTLSVQYHFLPTSNFRPYVGVGVNLTLFSDVDFDPAVRAALQPSVESKSFGMAYGAGFDYKLTEQVYLNVDVKKVHIHAKVKAFGEDAGTLKVNPVLFGIGIGYRF